MSRPIDFVTLAQQVAANTAPTHVLLELARRVPIIFHIPGAAPFQLHFPSSPFSIPTLQTITPVAPTVTTQDRLRAKLISRPDLWALARHAISLCTSEDTLFCTGEDVGIPLAAARAKMPRPPRLVVTVHNIQRPRAKLAFKLFHTLRHVSDWVTPAPLQADYLQSLGIPKSAISLPPEQSDTRFFTPAPPPSIHTPANHRPLIVSVGLEQRDYRTLAAATSQLPMDVNISGSSPDARALSRAFPTPMPANMTRQVYSWPDLRELYHKADLVVVPVFQNRYLAGITGYLEALACRKPVIVSGTTGLLPYLDPARGLIVEPENPAHLRSAIQKLLHSPVEAQALAHHGHAWLLAHHQPCHWVDSVLNNLITPHRAAA